MDKVPKMNKIQGIETALHDLQGYERKYEGSTAKLKNLSIEVDKLKTQKQMLKASLDDQKRTLTHYTNLHVEIASKIQNILVSQNKGKLVESSNMQNVKQIEAKIIESKSHFNEFGIKIHQNSGLKHQKEDLLLQKKKLEQIIANNKQYMGELLSKLKS